MNATVMVSAKAAQIGGGLGQGGQDFGVGAYRGMVECLSVWAGRGLGARITATFSPGHDPVVTFEGRDLVVVWTDPQSPPWLGTGTQDPSAPRRAKFELRLDPATGRTLAELDEPC